ncbi:MAG: hypothetical protein HKO57_17255 [Akkermansiaceae bacterium]|nr:hypothetical protein [Akkermansiaceae bacterium]
MAASGVDQPWLFDWLESLAGSPWLLAVAFALATFASEDLACIAAGLLAAKGVVDFPVAVVACAVGIWIGDIGLYALGYLAGQKKRHWRWLDRIVTPARVAKGRRIFDSYGIRWVFVSRFLPGMRLPSYLAAGVIGWSFRKFVFALAVGAWIWTPVLCGLAYSAGRKVLVYLEAYQRWVWPVLIAVLLFIWLATQLVVPLFSWRGRRLLVGRLRRWRRWEYWPVWAVYPPVAVALALQAVRLRGATLFTCCDPAIPHSGFALESKGDILDALDPPDEEAVRIAKYLRLAPGQLAAERMEALRRFLSAEGLGYPVVLKPDVGERGQGVAVVDDEAGAEKWFEAFHGPAMVQEFVPGREFGVSWHRAPGAAHGEITSVAGKHPQILRGDGEHTVEELILRDDRAVAMAPYFLRKFEGELDRVPGRGEEFPLTRIGTHARGAVFSDDRHLVTEPLRETLDALAARYEGFHLGRYDLRVASEEDLCAGRGLVVLELNGVTGEPVHIYEPGYSWWRGMRDLGRHWRTACELGAANRRRGAKPTSLGGLLRLIRLHRRQNWFEADELIYDAEGE